MSYAKLDAQKTNPSDTTFNWVSNVF